MAVVNGLSEQRIMKNEMREMQICSIYAEGASKGTRAARAGDAPGNNSPHMLHSKRCFAKGVQMFISKEERWEGMKTRGSLKCKQGRKIL